MIKWYGCCISVCFIRNQLYGMSFTKHKCYNCIQLIFSEHLIETTYRWIVKKPGRYTVNELKNNIAALCLYISIQKKFLCSYEPPNTTSAYRTLLANVSFITDQRKRKKKKIIFLQSFLSVHFTRNIPLKTYIKFQSRSVRRYSKTICSMQVYSTIKFKTSWIFRK